MKLYDVPAGAKIRIKDTGDVIYKFYNLDGMFSYCTDEQGNVVHPEAWTEVEIVKE